jgi:hypothetical protein
MITNRNSKEQTERMQLWSTTNQLTKEPTNERTNEPNN